MAHVVETGAGLANANAYLAYTEADAYFTDHGAPSGWTGTQAAKEQAIRLATQYLDALYGARWKGYSKSSTQALDWPRSGVTTADGWLVVDTALPQALKDACSEAALKSISGDTLVPDLAAGAAPVMSKRVRADVVESEISFAGAASPYKTYTLIDFLLADLIAPRGEVERG